MEKLRDKVFEAVKIAQECPENLQQICFETLLKIMLSAEKETATKSKKPISDKGKQDPKSEIEELSKKQDDLSKSDLHLKVQRFLDKYSLTVENLNQLYYKEGEEILSLYDDLKTTLTSESQVRITLLNCLHSALKTGNFQTTVETVREDTKMRKCYDKNNWANNYNNNAALFNFDKYSRNVKEIMLSEQGKKNLALLIKELQ